jgi:hypothetical protein
MNLTTKALSIWIAIHIFIVILKLKSVNLSNPVWLYNRSNHIILSNTYFGMEKMVCSIMNPYRIADPMTYIILD